MRKIVKKVVSVLLSGIATFSVFSLSSCGGKTRTDTLYIEAARLGYGLDWLDTIAEKWSEESGYEVKITKKIGNQGNEAIIEEIESHASTNDIFIFRTGDYARKVYEGEITVDGKKYDNVFLDLTDICTKQLDGEGGASIDSKLQQIYKDVYKIDGKYYGLPWIEGIMGILCNFSLWDELGLTDADIPLTTDQLFETCDKIKMLASGNVKYQNVTPFIYSSEDEYYTSFMEAWFMQYAGEENVKNFMAGKDPSGNVSQNIFTYPGLQEMFSVVEKLVKGSNGYQHPKSDGLNFTDMQGQFLRNQAVFSVNGAWIELEMGASFPDVEVAFIDTPIISAIVEQLSFYNENASNNENDLKLRELVKYVDSTEDGYENKPEWASEEDVDTIRAARKYNYSSQGGAHVIVGSSYSPKQEMIKSFIEYMYSDKGMNCYYEATGGAKLPLNLSSSGSYKEIEMSDFQKKINAIDRDELFVYASSAKMFSIGGVDLKFNNGVSNYIKSFANGSLTASGILQKNMEFMNSNWSAISSKIK